MGNSWNDRQQCKQLLCALDKPCWKSISYNRKLHCVLLVGYDENNYFFNDPMAKKIQGYSKASVEKAYAALGKQAIVITRLPAAVQRLRHQRIQQ